jgi:hypothetical protein
MVPDPPVIRPGDGAQFGRPSLVLRSFTCSPRCESRPCWRLMPASAAGRLRR